MIEIFVKELKKQKVVLCFAVMFSLLCYFPLWFLHTFLLK